MAHGLERIGNRKLTECLIDLLKSDTHVHPGKKFPDIVVTRKNRSSSANMILLISMRVLMLFIIIYTSLENESITHHQTPDTQSDSFATVQWSPKFKNSYNCNQSIGNDLPEIHGHFMGRKNDTKAIINKVMKAKYCQHQWCTRIRKVNTSYPCRIQASRKIVYLLGILMWRNYH